MGLLFFSWLLWVPLAVRVLSLVVENGGSSLAVVPGIPIGAASLVAKHKPKVCGLPQVQCMGSVVAGLVAS